MTRCSSGRRCPASSSNAATGPDASTSKRASTTAQSSPERIRSGWARAPMTSRIASTRIDLPAPVSPVRTFRPGANGTTTSSMTARLRMRSSLSMAPLACYGPRRPILKMYLNWAGRLTRLPLAPLELGAKNGEDVLLREPQQADARRGPANLDGVPLSQREAHLPVGREHHILIREQPDVDALVGRQHDRAVREGVGTDRREHHRVHRRKHDRAAG